MAFLLQRGRLSSWNYLEGLGTMVAGIRVALPLLEANWEWGHIPGGDGELFDSIQ